MDSWAMRRDPYPVHALAQDGSLAGYEGGNAQRPDEDEHKDRP